MILEELLEHAGVEFRPAARRYEVWMCCPFCETMGESEDTRYRLSLNIEKGLAHCFNCGWSSNSLIHTIRKLSAALRVPVQLRYVSRKHQTKPVRKEEEVKAIALNLPREYEPLTNSDDSVGAAARAFLKARQVSQGQIQRHRIGYAGMGPLAWRIIIPVLGGDGKVYGTVARSINSSMTPKYLNSEGIKLLWGGHQIGEYAVLCEGVFDALRVERALLRKKDWIALARLGSTITSTQISALRNYSRVVVLPDRDKAGVKGAAKLATACAEAGIQVWVSVPEFMGSRESVLELEGSDPGSMSDEEILDCIDAAEQWKKSTEWRLRESQLRRAV